MYSKTQWIRKTNFGAQFQHALWNPALTNGSHQIFPDKFPLSEWMRARFVWFFCYMKQQKPWLLSCVRFLLNIISSCRAPIINSVLFVWAQYIYHLINWPSCPGPVKKINQKRLRITLNDSHSLCWKNVEEKNKTKMDNVSGYRNPRLWFLAGVANVPL